MPKSLGDKAAKGAVWASIDRFGTMILQFIVNLILARLLFPEDFGAIGMIAIFITVSQVIIDGGFASALIQKKEPTQTDYSTIFFWNISLATVIYFLIYILSPLVGDFFKMPVLNSILQVLALTLILQSILAIQVTRLRKELAFKKMAITNIIAYFLGATIGITLAYKGYGVWSLVIMQISIYLFSLLIYAIITKWVPSLCFSKQTMNELFSFGGYIMASNILQTICTNLQGLIIGKKFSATQMGYYSQAYKLDNVTSHSVPQIIVSVMYPVYSSIQDDSERLRQVLLMNIRVLSFLIFPLMGLLIVISGYLIVMLYGDIWTPCIPYFRILCVGGTFSCLQNINFYAVAAVGKSRSLFYWSFYKWSFLLLALLVGMSFGMYGILWGMVLSSFNIYCVNTYLSSKYIGLNISNQIKAAAPLLIITIICTALLYILNNIFDIHPVVSAAIYIITYLSICRYLKIKALSESIDIIHKLINR